MEGHRGVRQLRDHIRSQNRVAGSNISCKLWVRPSTKGIKSMAGAMLCSKCFHENAQSNGLDASIKSASR